MIKRSRQGMTLIELVTVVAMLIILTGAAFPLFNATIAQSRLNGAVQRVGNDLRNVRSLAVSQGGFYRLHSGDDGGVQPGQYRLERSPTGLAPWTSVTPWYAVATDFRGAAIASIRDAANTALLEVSFNASGASANAGPFPISIAVTTPVGTKSIQVMRAGNIVVP